MQGQATRARLGLPAANTVSSCLTQSHHSDHTPHIQGNAGLSSCASHAPKTVQALSQPLNLSRPPIPYALGSTSQQQLCNLVRVPLTVLVLEAILRHAPNPRQSAIHPLPYHALLLGLEPAAGKHAFVAVSFLHPYDTYTVQRGGGPGNVGPTGRGPPSMDNK